MKVHACGIAGAWVVEASPHEDARGRFLRAWCQREFAEQGIDFLPVQANMGLSTRSGTIRGLHYQIEPALEAKLVRCTRGAVFDVLVDLRPASPTYRTWFGAELSADNARMLYVPVGCAHGCQSMVDDTEILYLTSAFYEPSTVRGIRYDDPAFRIAWPLAPTEVSDQDRRWPLVNSQLERDLP